MEPFSSIDYPGASTTEAWGINARGDIIGRYTRAGITGVRSAWQQRHRVCTTHCHGANRLVCHAQRVIPGGGIVAGLTFPTATTARGYVLSGDTLTFLDAPGSTFTQAWDVNPTGVIVGQYAAGGRTHGFYYADGEFVAIDIPGSTMTVARGINPRGDIVGVYNDPAGAHGFVLRR